MITNREISTPELLEVAVTEVVESARENGVDEAEIAATLREQAATVADADPADERA